MNRVYVKETEKTKYRPKQIVDMMKEEGYKGFTMHQHTELWQALNAKMPEGKFGSNGRGNDMALVSVLD